MSEVIELHRPSPAVEVRDLRKEFSRRDKKAGRFARKKRAALQGVTFTIERGECVAILGQNGSGKSTLVRLLSTLLFHDGGSAEVFGHDVFAEPRPVRKLVNRVSVEASFFKKMSAGENLHYAARYYGMGPRETRVKIPAILTKVGFPVDRRTEPMENLSRGMQQKVALARALLTSPVLLLLDEPTTGLDPQARHLLWDRLYRLKQRGVTLVLTTHYMDEAEQLCDRLVVMDKAKIVAEGSPRELIEQYSTREVTELRFPAGVQETLDGQLDGLATRIERLADRVLLYADDGEAVAVAAHERGLRPETVLVRRSSLEDVFLRLTGRSLIE
jgi:lipooligosaccharide transport system ATP-binding protein